MSNGYQKFTALGGLTRDAELRTTAGGQAVLKFSVAVTETYLDRNRAKQQKTEYVNCVLWGKRGEALAQYLSKGKQVMIEGKLQSSKYENKEGVTVHRTEVNVLELVLCGGGGSSERRAPRSNYEQPSDDGATQAPTTNGRGFDDAEYGDVPDDNSFPFD